MRSEYLLCSFVVHIIVYWFTKVYKNIFKTGIDSSALVIIKVEEVVVVVVGLVVVEVATVAAMPTVVVPAT